MRQFFASMSYRARIAFGISVLLIAGTVGLGLWWLMHPPYGVLYSNLRQTDAAEITVTLGQMQVPFRLADQGKVILVPADQVYETRMQLVSKGVPKGGSVGFELFKDSDYGVTEFAQKVNYQRALQGELERTISSLAEVDSARVHLTIRHADLFQTDKDPSKASVTLTLRQGKHLDSGEVAGIQRLVASAVDGLSAASVVVLDDQGKVLSGSAAQGQDGALNSDSLSLRTRLEGQLRTRVDDLLRRVLRTSNFAVSVDVSLNYDHVKQVRERLISQGKDGNGLLVREKIDSSGHMADDSAADHAKRGPVTSNDRELEFAHGTEQEEVDRAPGRIERISVGIVIPSTLPKEEIGKLSGVVSASLGLDPSRGDKVDIAAIAPPEVVAASAQPVPRTNLRQARTPVDSTASSSDKPLTKPISQWTKQEWLYPVLAALVLFVLGALLMARRTVSPRRLTMSEREEALLRLRQWIESTEAE